MAQETENQRIEARLAALEENLREVRTALQALLHAQVRQEAAGGEQTAEHLPEAIDDWLDGELQSMAAQAPSQIAPEQEVQGFAIVQSTLWCKSRYVCVTFLAIPGSCPYTE